MRKHLLLLAIIAAGLSACDNMRDTDTPLAGMWQMTRWTENESGKEVIESPNDGTSGIYYCIQKQLIKFQIANASNYHLSHLTHKGDSLLIGTTIDYPGDTLVEAAVLQRYGVDNTLRFKIKRLTSKSMELENEDYLLTFRKY